MSRPIEHGMRSLDDQRRGFLKGQPLPSATAAAVKAKATELACGRGGLRRCNGVEKHLLYDMALCALIRDAVLDEVERRGSLFTSDGALLPVFRALGTFMNTFRLHAMAIGIKPDLGEQGETLEVYLKKRAAQPAPAPAADNARGSTVAPPVAGAEPPIKSAATAAACSPAPAEDPTE